MGPGTKATRQYRGGGVGNGGFDNTHKPVFFTCSFDTA